MEDVDGLMLTGGGLDLYLNWKLKIPSKFEWKVSKIIQKIKDINDQGKQFPIWATCLGFEALIISESKYTIR